MIQEIPVYRQSGRRSAGHARNRRGRHRSPRRKIDFELYETAAPGNTVGKVASYADEHAGEDVCFVACGGVGTLNEIVRGAIGKKNACITCYLCGSGNDFVKYYGGKDRFLNIGKLVRGTEHRIDGMRVNDTYSINVVNFGFDTVVCQAMINVCRKPIIGGKNAYTTGIVTTLIKAVRTKCKITVDGEVINDGGMLMCTIANGHYVGSAFKCAPNSNNEDGLLEICKFKPISRTVFPKLIGVYSAGKHLEDERYKDIITYLRGKKVVVDSAAPGFAMSVDGEIVTAPHFEIEILPGEIRFIMPEGAAEI